MRILFGGRIICGRLQSVTILPFCLHRTATASPDAANAHILLTIAVTTRIKPCFHSNYNASFDYGDLAMSGIGV